MQRKRTYFIVIAIILLIISCSVPKNDPSTSKQTENQNNTETFSQKIEESEDFSALVIFASGNVVIEDQGTLVEAVIGSELQSSAWISTGPDSECEISLGSHASVILQANTKIQINMLLSSTQRTASEMSVATGTVIAKVQKLTSGDQFRVRTPTMVAGVRGTVFSVNVQENKPVTLAVDEGLVAIYPLSLLPEGEEHPAGIDSNDVEIMELTELLQQSAAVVQAGDEMLIEEKSMQVQEAVIVEALEVIRSNSVKNETTPEDREIRKKEIETIASKYQNSSSELEKSAKPVSAPAKQILQKGEKIQLRSFDESSVLETSLEKSIQELDSREVEKNDQSIVSSTTEIPPSSKKDETSKSVSERELVASTSTQLEPSVERNEKPTATRYPKIVEAVIASKKIVSLTVEGINRLVVSDSSGKIYLVGSDKSVIWSRSDQNGTNTASPAVVDGPLVVFSGDKTLFACNTITGDLLWTLSLDATNTGLYGRRPVIFKNMVFVPGDAGITRYKARTGQVDGTVTLGDGTDMSASIWNEALYVVSKSGTFYEIDPVAFSIVRSVSTNAFQPVASAPVFFDRKAFFADRRGTVTCIDLDTLSISWQRKLVEGKNIEVFADPVVSSAGIFIQARGTLFGLSIKNGSSLFEPKQGITTSPYAEGHLLWAGAGGSTLVEMNARDGTINRSLTLSSGISGTPVRQGMSLVIPLQNGSLAYIEGYKPM